MPPRGRGGSDASEASSSSDDDGETTFDQELDPASSASIKGHEKTEDGSADAFELHLYTEAAERTPMTWAVSKRYSEFEALREQLRDGSGGKKWKKEVAKKEFAAFPKKSYTGTLDAEALDARMAGLELWLNSVLTCAERLRMSERRKDAEAGLRQVDAFLAPADERDVVPVSAAGAVLKTKSSSSMDREDQREISKAEKRKKDAARKDPSFKPEEIRRKKQEAARSPMGQSDEYSSESDEEDDETCGEKAKDYGEQVCVGAKWLYNKTVVCCTGCTTKCAEKYGKVDGDSDDDDDDYDEEGTRRRTASSPAKLGGGKARPPPKRSNP